MTEKMTYRLGAIFYTLWGLLHILAGLGSFQLGTEQSAGLVQAKLYQNGWNLIYLAVFAIVIAVRFNWKNSWAGYWLNLCTISVADIGYMVLIFLPGYTSDLTGPILWILGAIFSTIGVMKSPRTI